MAVILYGIRNCDSVKKAQNWLKQNNITFELVDFKQNSPEKALIAQWVEQVGWEKLLNKQSKTFRELAPEHKEINNAEQAEVLMHQYPLLIKRPVLISGTHIMVGFSESAYNTLKNYQVNE
ncbi:Spx/MgsR family RNA polymerase-binding regulatory protein [Tolumonas lignilytica]|uniref:Spx/MgsR family RNA polymerase-binding regulatory protein n=1 Tax=Tolumonas lignilytica TaxID=1283284 RepID=UPI0004640D84|nr:Spx/MgsR family RNA polymerase-binding regulatory protein [Tolumonas lignilytica]